LRIRTQFGSRASDTSGMIQKTARIADL